MTSHPAIELRAALKVAARRAMSYGATDQQIDDIVALSRGAGEYDLRDYGNLTQAEAGRIIDFMFDQGVDPEYRKSDDEIAAERDRDIRAAASTAAKKIANAETKLRKVAAEERQAAKDRAIEGRRVTHAKFGEGTVIAETDAVITVMFDSQKKQLRLAPAFLTAI